MDLEKLKTRTVLSVNRVCEKLDIYAAELDQLNQRFSEESDIHLKAFVV